MDYNEIQNIAFSKLSSEFKDNVELCERELLKQQIKADNEKVGILNKNDGITCKICKNKGYVVVPGENLSELFLRALKANKYLNRDFI